MSEKSAPPAKDGKGDKSTWCYAEHTPGLKPGEDGYCSGNCNRGLSHGDSDHVCNACGKSF